MDERNDRDGRLSHEEVRIVDPEDAGFVYEPGAEEPLMHPAGDRQPFSGSVGAGGYEPDRRDGEDHAMTDETYHEERQALAFDDLPDAEPSEPAAAAGGAGEDESAGDRAITLQGHTVPPWTDPTTGDAPAIRPDEQARQDDLSAWQAIGPRPPWRDSAKDWDDVEELEHLGSEETRVDALDTSESEQSEVYTFDEDFERFEESRAAAPSTRRGAEGDETPAGAFPAPGVTSSRTEDRSDERTEREAPGPREGRRGSASRGPRRPPRPGGSRALGQAARTRRQPARAARGADQVGTRIAAGLALLAVLLIFYFIGSAALMVLSAVVVGAAAAEGYGMLQRAGFKPATLLGLVASVAIIGGAYWRGEGALPLIIALTFAGSMLWYLFGIVEARPLANIAVTNLLFIWVGVLGSFGALMLRGTDGRGLFLGAVVVAVGADIAAYFSGSRLGKRTMAPSVSPGKTWEGAAAGLIAALIIGAIIGKALDPWGGMKHGLVFGLLVGIIAPFGDLSESMIKRDLGLKNSGSLIPGHGGLLDRVDAILFVLPIAYFFSSWTGILKG